VFRVLRDVASMQAYLESVAQGRRRGSFVVDLQATDRETAVTLHRQSKAYVVFELQRVERCLRVAASRSGVLWRATADEDGHYSFAIPLCCRSPSRVSVG